MMLESGIGQFADLRRFREMTHIALRVRNGLSGVSLAFSPFYYSNAPGVGRNASQL
eukprot:CAMPEP_0183359732 /NCGR_PEP_ID=MMETSP0164_2-20130417/53111_1 /TAXON_ID=221442 /ORGANISM="Coccolithus pelagicus ssp braarudi, Strain PLY182g" /LENGTH=55 /DNA_ID=CAMNT_0025533913 /DNA_START=115 /DNA_END=279 /DNA_ORIENTATION=+